MQILHPFTGSAHQYAEEVSTPDRYRPDHCPQCPALQPLIAHGFYSRTLAEAGFDGSIRVRRYLCRSCRRTVPLLPHFALPYLRFGITMISLFLVARLLQGATSVRGRLDRPAFVFEQPAHDVPDLRIVVDHEHDRAGVRAVSPRVSVGVRCRRQVQTAGHSFP